MSVELFTKSIGWHDSVLDDPTYDPIPNNTEFMEPSEEDVAKGVCLYCEKPLEKGNTKTISMRWAENFKRSYFYRRHSNCPSEGLDDKAWAMIEKFSMESPVQG